MKLRLFALVCVLIAGPASAQMTPIVRMDCRSGTAFPNCGAGRTVGNDVLGTKWDRAYIASEDAVEISMRPGATGEGYYGWQWTGLQTPALGSTRVLRARVKVVSPIAWGDWGAKFMVVGDVQNNASQRIIATMSLYQNRPHLNVDKNIDGRYAFAFLTPDAYTSVQIVAAPVTPGTQNPYSFKYYADGVLVATSVPFSIAATTWRDFNIGYYGQYGSAGHVQIRFKDVEFDDEFDPNYHTGTTAPPPPPPPPPCAFAVAPTSVAFSADGGSAVVTVTPSRDGCPWGTSGSSEWLTLDPAAGGVRVTAAGGARVVRTATLTIAGQAVSVQQGGVPPPPPPPPVPPVGFTGTLEYIEGRLVRVVAPLP